MVQKQQENKGGGRGTSFDIAVLCVVFSKGRFFLFFFSEIRACLFHENVLIISLPMNDKKI